MSDPSTTDESSRRDELEAELQRFGEELKNELATRIDQKLDELGARIGD